MKFNRRITYSRCIILPSAMPNETPAWHCTCVTIWITIYHDNFCQRRPDWAGSGKVKTSYLPAKASSKDCSLLKGLNQNSALPTPVVLFPRARPPTQWKGSPWAIRQCRPRQQAPSGENLVATFYRIQTDIYMRRRLCCLSKVKTMSKLLKEL